MPRPARTELLILQPTPYCNLDCSYCYLPARNNTSRISEAVLEAAFRQVLGSRYAAGDITVLWHAGEPLVLPMDWYARAFAQAERHRPAKLVDKIRRMRPAGLADFCGFERNTVGSKR